MLSISPLTMDECPICNRHVLPHAKQAKCCICLCNYHMKCLSLQPDVCEYIKENNPTWCCQLCITKILPYNHIENDDVFMSNINCIEAGSRSIEQLSEIIFNPFELNTDDHYSPLYDADPDMNYYNELDSHIGLNCNYYFDNSFQSVIQEKLKHIDSKHIFSLCHINIRSLKANLPALENCLDVMDFDFSIIGISETWLRDWNCDLYNIEGYDFVESHRPVRTGGGVGIYLKRDIPFQHRTDLIIHSDLCEYIFVEIEKEIFQQSKNIVIAVIYRPPGTDLKAFSDAMHDLLNAIKRENKIFYLMGDYNINLLNYGKHNETNEFVDMMHAHSFISLINRPTRVNQQSATLIDNIFTNKHDDLVNTFQCLIYTDISDHYPIIHMDYSMKGSTPDSHITRRNLSQRNRLQFYNEISAMDWDLIYQEIDTQEAFSAFHRVLLKVYNKHFPKQKVDIKYSTRKLWPTQGLKDAIRTKNKLYKKYMKCKTVANEKTYKRYRNKLNIILKCAEKQHFTDLSQG